MLSRDIASRIGFWISLLAMIAFAFAFASAFALVLALAPEAAASRNTQEQTSKNPSQPLPTTTPLANQSLVPFQNLTSLPS
jgi:cytochrome oxidase Cu insertion factor (SCO1/SenC/PrrC family)